MRRLLRDNGLSIVMFGLFVIFVVAQSVTGLLAYNEEQRDHGQPAVGFGEYLTSGSFIEGVFENWESEFLQMGAYVLLTVFLFQRGSSESKDPDKREAVDEDPRAAGGGPQVPGPVRRGGLALLLYEHSLSLTLFGLFLISFCLHAVGGAMAYSQEQLQHGGEAVTVIEYLATPRFWFESFQNWQSEFLSVGLLVVLSIYLRERGSPESKPVAAAHHETGQTPG